MEAGTQQSAGPIQGWRVLKIADGVAASVCAKVLADLGAEVLVLEPPGGHPRRADMPRRPGGAGARFADLNTNTNTNTRSSDEWG